MIEFCGVHINPRNITAVKRYDVPNDGEYPHGLWVITSDGEKYTAKYMSRETRDRKYRDILNEIDSLNIKRFDVLYECRLSEIAKALKRIDNRLKKVLERCEVN